MQIAANIFTIRLPGTKRIKPNHLNHAEPTLAYVTYVCMDNIVAIQKASCKTRQSLLGSPRFIINVKATFVLVIVFGRCMVLYLRIGFCAATRITYYIVDLRVTPNKAKIIVVLSDSQ